MRFRDIYLGVGSVLVLAVVFMNYKPIHAKNKFEG